MIPKSISSSYIILFSFSSVFLNRRKRSLRLKRLFPVFPLILCPRETKQTTSPTIREEPIRYMVVKASNSYFELGVALIGHTNPLLR